MEIAMSPTQYEELQILVAAVRNLKNQSGSASGEITIDSTKVEYGANEVKFTISD